VRLNIFKQTTARVPRTRLIRLPNLILRGEGLKGLTGVVNLVFTTDRRMRQLNRDYRKINHSTDVLSFNLDDGKARDSVLGEIYISVPTATRQARRHQVSPASEYLRLAVHGLLHLLGYDHANPRDEQRMMLRQENYLSRLRGSRR